MDTQTQRKLEQLFELLALPPQRVAPRMRVVLAPCVLMIEVDAQGVTLVLTLIDRAARAQRWLPMLLQTCAPGGVSAFPCGHAWRRGARC